MLINLFCLQLSIRFFALEGKDSDQTLLQLYWKVMFVISYIYMSEIVKLYSDFWFVFFFVENINEMFMDLFGQILMNVKNCLDFAKEENALIHLVASSVSVHQGTT